MTPPKQFQDKGPTAPDELTIAQGTERVAWSLPSDEGLVGQAPGYVPTPTVDSYLEGIFVGHDLEADAQQVAAVSNLIRARVDSPNYQIPHEATHRRYDTPQQVVITQTAAGFTLLLPPKMGLHYIKLLGIVIVATAAAGFTIVQGSTDGTVTAAMTGAMPLAASGGFVLPPARIETPWMFTAPDQALGIVTTSSTVFGYALCCYSPYDQ